MSESALPSNVFNTAKTDYRTVKPIFNEAPGLFDSMNKQYPKQWELYKTLKSLDWDENEFDYSICNLHFKTCDRFIYDRMLKTLAWQWETDTVAARTVAIVMNCINPADELLAGYTEIIKNEVTHSLTYSEIVRMSFDDPEEAMNEILAVKESFSRLELVASIFSKAKKSALRFASDPTTYNQEMYNDIFMFFVALFVVERVQFMASFAITFGICQTTGFFQPAGSGIQKIAQDEFEIHVKYGQGMLKALMETPEGRIAYNTCLPQISALVNEVVQGEVRWNNYTFSEDGEIVGVNLNNINQWVYHNATDAAKFLDVHHYVDFPLVEKNPLKFMEDWLNMEAVQRSPQEEDNGAYKVGVIESVAGSTVYPVDF